MNTVMYVWVPSKNLKMLADQNEVLTLLLLEDNDP